MAETVTPRSPIVRHVLLVALLAACGRADRSAAPGRPAVAPTSAPVVATAAAARPAPDVATVPAAPEAPTPTPQTLSVVVPLAAEPTPGWTPRPTPTPRTPTPTPPPSQCLDLEWWIGEGTAPLGSTLVEVEVTNRCGRDLDGLQVWFEAAGYRGGGLYQSVRGHLFEELRAGRQGSTGLLLPCSTDWCDEIRVRVVDPLPP